MLKLWIAIGFGVGLVISIAIVLIVLASPEDVNRIPDPGIYLLPASEISITEPNSTGSFNLTLTGSRYNSFTIKDTNIGSPDSGINVFEITGATGDIYVDTMTADGLTCPMFFFSDTDIHTANYTDNLADGNNFSLSNGSPSNITIASQRGSKDYIIDASSYDKIVLTASADVEIAALTISNVRAFGGACDFSGLKIGTLNVINSVVGTGDGTTIKDFGFSTGVVIGTLNQSNNVETEIDVR